MEKHEKIIQALVLKIKEGNGGESDNALKALQKLCTKHDLDIDEVMTGKKVEDRWYKVTPFTHDLTVQIVLRYGDSHEIFDTTKKKHVVVALDEAHHLEVSHALDVLIRAYTKELKKVKEATFYAFIEKHDLYWKGERPERIGTEKPKTPAQIKKERERALMASRLSQHMEDVTVNKRLE